MSDHLAAEWRRRHGQSIVNSTQKWRACTWGKPVTPLMESLEKPPGPLLCTQFLGNHCLGNHCLCQKPTVWVIIVCGGAAISTQLNWNILHFLGESFIIKLLIVSWTSLWRRVFICTSFYTRTPAKIWGVVWLGCGSIGYLSQPGLAIVFAAKDNTYHAKSLA